MDDEPDLRTLYELTLLREGYRVETAGSVQEAREQLQGKRFDVMISDMRLPDGTGMELLLQLREQEERVRRGEMPELFDVKSWIAELERTYTTLEQYDSQHPAAHGQVAASEITFF